MADSYSIESDSYATVDASDNEEVKPSIALDLSIQNNPSPLLDLKEVVKQVNTNTKLFRYVTVISGKEKFISQVQPNVDQMPAVGFTIEFGDVTDNLTNESMGQFLDITLCCTVVLNVSDDITGSKSHYQFVNDLLPDLNHSIYNWQPSNSDRYINGFKLHNFQRIEACCSNAYEVYCVYYEIPCQIDYLDGYIPPTTPLKSISTTTSNIKIPSSSLVVNIEGMSKLF